MSIRFRVNAEIFEKDPVTLKETNVSQEHIEDFDSAEEAAEWVYTEILGMPAKHKIGRA